MDKGLHQIARNGARDDESEMTSGRTSCTAAVVRRMADRQAVE